MYEWTCSLTMLQDMVLLLHLMPNIKGLHKVKDKKRKIHKIQNCVKSQQGQSEGSSSSFDSSFDLLLDKSITWKGSKIMIYIKKVCYKINFTCLSEKTHKPSLYNPSLWMSLSKYFLLIKCIFNNISIHTDWSSHLLR